MRPFWNGPRPVVERDFGVLQHRLCAIVDEVHRRAPRARVALVSYPQIVPTIGTCRELGLAADEAALMRDVGQALAHAMREAALASGALLVDMGPPSATHAVGSMQPWVSGATRLRDAPFHPTREGTLAMALQVAASLGLAVSGEVPSR